MFLVLATTLQAQSSARGSARDVYVRIETDRATYRVGDSICVRLTLRNVSTHLIRFENETPSSQIRLHVYDAAGHPVQRGPIYAPGQASGPSARLEAGKEATLNFQNRTWLNLRDWGYDLQVAGRYTIVGIPGVAGPALTPDYKTVRSNKATFTITP